MQQHGFLDSELQRAKSNLTRSYERAFAEREKTESGSLVGEYVTHYLTGVRHGCFCAHPYLLRLLGLSPSEVLAYREAVLTGDRRTIPGAVRASAGLSTTPADVDRLVVCARRHRLG